MLREGYKDSLKPLVVFCFIKSVVFFLSFEKYILLEIYLFNNLNKNVFKTYRKTCNYTDKNTRKIIYKLFTTQALI